MKVGIVGCSVAGRGYALQDREPGPKVAALCDVAPDAGKRIAD